MLHGWVSMVSVITELLAEQLCNRGSISGMGRHFILIHSVLTGARALALHWGISGSLWGEEATAQSWPFISVQCWS